MQETSHDRFVKSGFGLSLNGTQVFVVYVFRSGTA